jgi:hypothetical protein
MESMEKSQPFTDGSFRAAGAMVKLLIFADVRSAMA